MKTGSLCSGYGGLDRAAQAVLGGELAWVADPDPGASAVLAHRFPSVPNLADITAVDWSSVEPVDLLTAGYPCQPWSAAGRRKGTADVRHLWPYVAAAIGAIRPATVILENVQGHLTLGFDIVLADLAALSYDAEWVTVTASAAGACHRRARLFVIAFPARARAVSGTPVAVIRDGAWLGPEVSLFGAVPFAGRVPASGSMAGGRIYAAAEGTTAMAAGLLKTPTAQLAVNGGSQHPDKRRAGGHGPTLADQVEHELLPTPTAADGDRASGTYERGNPTLLGALLPTPTANISGRTPEQHMAMRESIGRATPSQLEAAARLLPTPSVADGTGGHKTRSGDQKDEPLLGGIAMLLPTPTSMDSHGSRNATAKRSEDKEGVNNDGWTLCDVFWTGDGPGAGTRRVDPRADGIDWGPYEAAIRRWESVTGRPAPRPTVPGKTGERLNPELPQWMMGLPAGWITEVPGLSRNAQLKLAGNGVVPQQAGLALRILIDRAGIAGLEAAA